MTTNQQIDKIIASLYTYQVKQKMEWAQLPDYDMLCKELFAEIPDLSARHYQNLLYMLISKRLINIHADTPEQAYNNPVSLRPEVIVWYEQFHSYLNYLDYLEEKNQPKAFQEDYDEDINSEEIERKSIWAKMPLWLKIALLIAVVIGVVIIVMGINTAA
jgi:hypothetical protein